MPPPLLLTTILLIGWPALQLLSVLVARSRRARLRTLIAELKNDPRYGSADHALVDRVARGGEVKAVMIFAPLLLPLALCAEIAAELFGHTKRTVGGRDAYANLRETLFAIEVRSGGLSGAETVGSDPRFSSLRRVSFEISCLRRPFSSLLTATTCLPLLPVFFLAYGVRQTATAVARTLNLLAHALSLVTVGLPTVRPR